ncbi:Protein MAIN-LIKE 1 [Glycine soja]
MGGMRCSKLANDKCMTCELKVWEDQERMICPRCNYVWSFTHLDRIDNRVKNLINEASFGRVITISQIDINQHLVTALIERWRPKTHISFSNWALRLADDIPPDKYIKEKMIYLIWLWQNFQQLIDRDDVIAQHAKAHIMMLKGRYLMQDTSRTKIYH